MTPQERQLVEELFDRLASLENAPRDPDAVAAINAGLSRAPNALYALAQTVLVQDEALRRADGRIRELENELQITPEQPAQQKSFLDGMRDTLAGRREQQGSVPSVRPGGSGPAGSKWGSGTTLGAGRDPSPQGGYAAPEQTAGPFGGGSFLGTAAATAAGVVGGALLMNSFRGMFGGGQQGGGQQAQGALDQGGGSPWDRGSGESSGDLARQAGADDIGSDRSAAADTGDAQRQGAFDVAQNDPQYAGDSDHDGDFGGDFDLGDDTA